MKFNFGDLLRRAGKVAPGKVAVNVVGDRSITYAGLLSEASALAETLVGIEGQNIGILMPNCVDWVVCLYAVAMAGKTAVLLNSRLTVKELGYQIEQSDSVAVLTCALYGKNPTDLATTISGECPGCKHVIWFGQVVPHGFSGVQEWRDASRSSSISRSPVAEDTPAVIIYTSGTTSLPKGVVLSHYSVIVNALMVGRYFGVSSSDRAFCAGPFFHSGGLTMHVIMATLYVATAVSVTHFDADLVLDTVEGLQCTLYSGIETLFLRLLEAEHFAPQRVRSIRTGWATGSPSVVSRIASEVHIEGIVGVYGISESSPNVLISHYKDTLEHRTKTVGRPHPWSSARVVDPESGESVGTGGIGELVISGYGLMKGYYNKPDETAKALVSGWLHTGDLVQQRSDGYFLFEGRMKDIVRVGGENVSALEVEDALHALPEIALAAVIPVQDERYGEIPVAAVQARSNDLSTEKVLEALRSTLASYKVPRAVHVVDRMPLTESGKVQKRLLREQLKRSGYINE